MPSKIVASFPTLKKVKFVSVRLTVSRNNGPANVSKMVNESGFLIVKESAMVISRSCDIGKLDLSGSVGVLGPGRVLGPRGVLEPMVVFDGLGDLGVEEPNLMVIKTAATEINTKRIRKKNRVPRVR
jgi:hypothetical protein